MKKRPSYRRISMVEAAGQVVNQQDELHSISDFLIRNEDVHYFRILPRREYFDHTQYYYYEKQKPNAATKRGVNRNG